MPSSGANFTTFCGVLLPSMLFLEAPSKRYFRSLSCVRVQVAPNMGVVCGRLVMFGLVGALLAAAQQGVQSDWPNRSFVHSFTSCSRLLWQRVLQVRPAADACVGRVFICGSTMQ